MTTILPAAVASASQGAGGYRLVWLLLSTTASAAIAQRNWGFLSIVTVLPGATLGRRVGSRAYSILTVESRGS